MTDRDERVVAGTELVTLSDQFLHLRRSPHLRQQSPHQLPRQHVGDLAEYRPTQLQSVLDHQDLPLVLRSLQVIIGLLSTRVVTILELELLYLEVSYEPV